MNRGTDGTTSARVDEWTSATKSQEPPWLAVALVFVILAAAGIYLVRRKIMS